MKRRPDKGKTGPDPISLTGEVLDNLNRGMIRLDSNMNLTYANRTASRFLGKRHATLVGQALPSVISGPIGHTFSEAFLRALREKIVVSFEEYYPASLDLWLKVYCLPRDREIIAIFEDITSERNRLENEARNKALPRESKETSAQGISQEIEDVTGFKLMQTALRESQEKLKMALQAGKVGMFDWDMATNTISLSDELKAIYGVSPDYIGSMENWAKITPPEDISSLLDKLHQAVALQKKEVEGEYRIIHTDGNVRWMLSRGFIYYDNDRPIHMIGTAIDITETKNARDLLERINEELEERVHVHTRELEEANRMLKIQKEELQSDLEARIKMEQDLRRLTTAIDQAGEGFVLYNTNWVIEYVNPAFEGILGYTKDELIGKDVRFLTRDISTDLYPKLPFMIGSKGKTWRGRVKRKRKSGEAIEVHLTLSPVRDKDGEIIKFVSVVKDLTQEMRLQRRTAQAQKMEAIGTLAGGIAHDLRNIFTPILINSETAEQEVGKDNPAYPLLEGILEAARMGADLVKQIMTFTRQTSERKVPIDITSLVSEILTLLRSAVPKTIEIRTRTNTDDAIVEANPTQIKQVLMNLGSNAAYAMRGRHGLLEMDVACVELDNDTASMISPELSSGPYVEVAVRDTGEGIDEETLRRVFDPFFTTKQGEGTGMGLSVVQGIVKDHKGTVSVWSSPGKGSTFKVLLPKLGKESGAEIKEQ